MSLKNQKLQLYCNIKSNCSDADLVVLLTEWDEFKSIDFKKIVKNTKFKVFDLEIFILPKK